MFILQSTDQDISDTCIIIVKWVRKEDCSWDICKVFIYLLLFFHFAGTKEHWVFLGHFLRNFANVINENVDANGLRTEASHRKHTSSPQNLFNGLNVRAILEVISDVFTQFPVVLRCRQTFQSAMPRTPLTVQISFWQALSEGLPVVSACRRREQ